MSYHNPYNDQGMGGLWDDLSSWLKPMPKPDAGEYAIPGVYPTGGTSATGTIQLYVNGRTYTVYTPVGYHGWPEASKQAWQATQRVMLAAQSGTQASASGSNVSSIQAALNRLPSSLPRLAVDGNHGAKTTARIQEFQRLNGMSATGVLDANTIARIVSAAAVAGIPSGGQNPNPAALANYNAAPPPPGSSSNWIVYGIIGLVLVVVMSD